MSRIDELKKQHPNYALSSIDIYKMISPNQSNKYIEMLVKLDKEEVKEEYRDPESYRRQMIECMVRWGIDYNYLETFDLDSLRHFFVWSSRLMSDHKIKTFTKFASYNERKLIENNDVTSYSSWEEIENAVSLADIKALDKKLEKEIKKVYEDDTWISLRPLSLEASMKYGANTKWCTTTESGQYYARYASRGILIYNINKKTGYKVACFKNIDPNHDNEFSWWDVTDRRIEVLDSEAPVAVLEAVRNEIKNFPIPNQTLMTEEEQSKLELYRNGMKVRANDPFEPSLHISGGFTSSSGIINTINTHGTTIDYNPSTFITTSDNVIRFTSSGNVGMGTTTPNTQLQVNGDLEIDGDIVFRSEGEERMRLTSNGLEYTPSQPIRSYEHFEQPTEQDRQFYQELLREVETGERFAQQQLEEVMAERLAEANERVAQKHLSLLDNIELGTLDNDMILKMQALAGIKDTRQQIQELETEIEQIRARINEGEQEAEQPVLPSKPRLNIWDQIKSLIK